MSAEGFRARARPEPPSAQILVVVANTLERSWRTDAEKGFLSTAVAQVLVDPKPRAKALQRGPHESAPARHRAEADPRRTARHSLGDAGLVPRARHTSRAVAGRADPRVARGAVSGRPPGAGRAGRSPRSGRSPRRRSPPRPPRDPGAAYRSDGSTWRKGTRSRFRDPASRKRSPARSVRLVGAIRQPAWRSRRRTRGELSFLLKRPSIPGTRMARR